MTNSVQPLLSVLMTSYNREQYIAEAIESVLASTYTNFELIITDDCSTDNTVSIAQKYADQDARVSVYINEKNLGDYPNRNRAASYAKGEFLKYLDADDLIYEHGLDVMLKYMKRYPSAAFGLSFSVIDDDVPYPQQIDPEIFIRNEYLKKSYLGVGPSASIIKREAFEKVGGFSGKQYIGDTELWLKLASEYPMVLMNPSLNWWRQHPDQQITQELKKPEIVIQRLKLSLEFLQRHKASFNNDEFEFALKRKKQNFARSILSSLAQNKDFSRFIYLYRHSKISFFDLISGFRKYL